MKADQLWEEKVFMMKADKLLEAIGEINDEAIHSAKVKNRLNKKNKPVWFKWGAAAACLCVICLSAVIILNMLKGEQTPDNGYTVTLDTEQTSDDELTVTSDVEQSLTADSKQTVGEQEMFVPIASLLMNGYHGIVESAAFYANVSIEQYTGVYEKVQSVESAILSGSKGSNLSETEEWYYVSGHTDMQYLIRNVNGEYSLWKFSCFDSEEYPYSDVLELIYKIDSVDGISAIEVNPATMDNTDEGKAIQKQIGTFKITDREEIDTIYQILSSMTCYGSGRWAKIDYGDNEAPTDSASTHQAVLLGRYLSIVTDYGNEIDGLKYTAVSDMFYEFSGIAYNRLSTEQAESMRDILGITKNDEKLQNGDIGEDNRLSGKQSMDYRGDILSEIKNTSASLDDVTELQNRVSAAMMNGDLPFVISSAVYENPYRLYVVVTSNSESDLQKLFDLDLMGGIMEIEYVPANINLILAERFPY